ncbi:hypothetical protein TPY_2837 [Sulfobacillus acidophilus TPY]|nr:hypothetical protein TPY_2837 [Sulfobacillus acidophilus TPY]
MRVMPESGKGGRRVEEFLDRTLRFLVGYLDHRGRRPVLFRHHTWERLMANIGIVLIFAAFALRFLLNKS